MRIGNSSGHSGDGRTIIPGSAIWVCNDPAMALMEQQRVSTDPARLLSVNVGLPRDIVWRGRTVHTGIWKDPVQGRCHVARLNLHGDGQGDLAGHGGEQRAVFVYQMESYRHWQTQLSRADFTPGQFGEN